MSDLSRGDAARTRAYVSPRRAEQAKATRRAILDAARRLFLSNGYGTTSIRAIAEEAGVAVQTVYAVFGNKRQLVIELLEDAVTGNDHLVDSRAEDSETSAVRAEPDPRRRRRGPGCRSRPGRPGPRWHPARTARGLRPIPGPG